MVYIQYTNNPNNIFFSRKTADQYNIFQKRIILKIGCWSKELVVLIDDDLPEGKIGIPKKITESFSIPDELPYDLVLTGRILSLGPIIGFVAYLNHNTVTPKRLERLKGRFSNYFEIKGLIFVCAVRGIDVEKRMIEGFYYNPTGENASSRWISGTFPYPDVIYKRHPLDATRYNDLISQIGDKVINSYYFCKGELSDYALTNKELAKFLPYTETLSGVEQLERMLAMYKSAYLKPRDGAGGRGILYISKNEDGGVLVTNRKKENTLFTNKEELTGYLENLIHKKYIIQQCVSISHENRNVDFRVYAQKNGLQHWVCQGIIGRISKKDRIITNLKYTDKLLSGSSALKFLFNLNDDEVNKLINKIYCVCISTCQTLDKTVGNYGDVAIDCIIDSNYNIWILEINKLYGYDSLVKMKNRKLVKILMTTP
ncbi:YheC/YheD family protein [Bacillaceae bacterium Marseille-Q3522]|nr:YheC/YheD family protein [Bacillaceae bacterium Marseille-Q3522]